MGRGLEEERNEKWGEGLRKRKIIGKQNTIIRNREK